jgi:hypothetical protein
MCFPFGFSWLINKWSAAATLPDALLQEQVVALEVTALDVTLSSRA